MASWSERIATLKRFQKRGRTIWWRREEFHAQEFQGVEPKWHVLDQRSVQPGLHCLWIALCGYSRALEGVTDTRPGLRLDKNQKHPATSDRCKRCDALRKREKASRKGHPEVQDLYDPYGDN